MNLYSQFAADLRMYEAERKAEFASREADFITELEDPAHSFLAQLRTIEFEYIDVSEQDPNELTRYFVHSPNTYDALDERTQNLVNTHIVLEDDGTYSVSASKALDYLNYAAKEVLVNAPSAHLKQGAIYGTAAIAMLFKPHTTSDEWRKKTRNESPDTRVFRTAMFMLENIAKPKHPFSSEEMQVHEYLKYEAGHKSGIDILPYLYTGVNIKPPTLEAYNTYLFKTGTRKILNVVMDPAYTSAKFREQAIWMAHRQKTQAEIPSGVDGPKSEETLGEIPTPTIETGYRILAPAERARLGLGGDKMQPVEGAKRIRGIDEDRLRRIGHIMDLWGIDDTDVAVRKLQKHGDVDFLIAILRQTFNGIVIEHAIAESADSTRATFVFRAEQGLEDDGQSIWLDWQTVFNNDTEQAELLGARRMLHSKHFLTNLLDVVTRSPQRIHNRHYRH